MDASSFENIKRAVKAQHFKDEKLDAIRTSLSCSYGYLSADQVAQLVQEFPFDDERVKVVEICVPRMYSTTCQQAAAILRVFSFDKSKTQALEAFACHITDNDLAALESVFSFPSDRNRAREILMSRSPSGPQAGFPPQPGVYPGTGPPPGGFPGMAPQPGGFPGAAPYSGAPYPGAAPYPGQSPYPAPGPYGGGGMYPAGPSPYAPPRPAGVQYPTGTVPPPGAAAQAATFAAAGEVLNATAGIMKDMFGHPPNPRPQYPPQGGYYPPPAGYGQPPPGGYPQPGYPYQPPK